MDLATLIGLLSGVFLIGWALILGGQPQSYYDFNSILITLGGTLAATMISFPFSDLRKIPTLIRIAFQANPMDTDEIISVMVRFAEKARREGLLALEQDVFNIDDKFLQKGIQLVVDGTDPELLRNILETKLIFLEERHGKGQSIFTAMGTYAPAFGMIGTLVGLIQMLTQLEDPTALGPGMATALITTFYGVILANLVFLPMANKLKERSEKEILVKEIMIEGVLSIQAGENPRIVEEKLRAFLAEESGAEAVGMGEMDTTVVGENV
ncbi:MAG TPA: flagellar motor protein [Halanaerobiaceae bacterium]|nr:flagellar motor protein [Halanaerobiaceae bacterium]